MAQTQKTGTGKRAHCPRPWRAKQHVLLERSTILFHSAKMSCSIHMRISMLRSIISHRIRSYMPYSLSFQIVMTMSCSMLTQGNQFCCAVSSVNRISSYMPFHSPYRSTVLSRLAPYSHRGICYAAQQHLSPHLNLHAIHETVHVFISFHTPVSHDEQIIVFIYTRRSHTISDKLHSSAS